MNNIYWGAVGKRADVMAPGTAAGDGRCEAGEWGLAVEDVVVYGSVGRLRAWARSALEQLPQERDGEPLITVDVWRQLRWLGRSGVLGATAELAVAWAPDTESVRDVLHAVAADPGDAGWTLGEDVAALWADVDDSGDLVAGVVLSGTGHVVGIGRSMTSSDVVVGSRHSGIEQANACLTVIAERINGAY